MAALADISGIAFDLTDTNLRTSRVKANSAMSVGEAVSFDDTGSNWVLARAQNGDTDKLTGTLGLGICCSTPVQSGDGILIATYGTILVSFDSGSASKMVTGESYYVGTTAGEIIPYADLSASSKVSFLGVADAQVVTDTWEFKLAPFAFTATAS